MIFQAVPAILGFVLMVTACSSKGSTPPRDDGQSAASSADGRNPDGGSTSSSDPVSGGRSSGSGSINDAGAGFMNASGGSSLGGQSGGGPVAFGGNGAGDGSSSGGSGARGGSSAGGGGAGGGTGGSAGTGAGGSEASGGSSGGETGGGGAAGTGGTDATGGTSSDSFDISMHLASDEDAKAPTTVTIVEWSTSAGEPTSATIQFGLTTDYDMSVPVDVAAAPQRAVLLGMKPEQTYHVRIVANVGGKERVSDDRTITTGAAPDSTRLNISKYEVLSEDQRESGFILTSHWSGPSQGVAYILDQDGDPVWWYSADFDQGVAKAALSADMQNVWMTSSSNTGGEPLLRVGVDGLKPQEYDAGASHDVIPVEGEVMLYIGYNGWGVMEIDPSGQTRKVLDFDDIIPENMPLDPFLFHPNSLAYDALNDRYLLSSLGLDVFFFPRSGGTKDNLQRLTSMIGPNTGWGGRQHRAGPVPNDHLLLFANSGGQAEATSKVFEFDLDSGEEVWSYDSGEGTDNFGDVQRLPGGNTLVTYSNAGVIQEVTPDGNKVLEIVSNEYLGYATWFPSLYPAADNAAP